MTGKHQKVRKGVKKIRALNIERYLLMYVKLETGMIRVTHGSLKASGWIGGHLGERWYQCLDLFFIHNWTKIFDCI